ncbi:hypothetical protein FA09DRAFT_126904 [Tilletiopsis washingtonensis]|uniref:Uncharacterized protein n=1 Tax=Tilletiopsis washingtonensis TaxID=58919 RepID=A0A316Z6I0_9BASI|nr:hypothetical protein FA09DRAFT_126904 [Tilletiopsis washingtonensis]PWN95825.1 hypothetical protein FA09DRAFT_126904 [Tilletiopsis washingtonensis]
MHSLPQSARHGHRRSRQLLACAESWSRQEGSTVTQQKQEQPRRRPQQDARGVDVITWPKPSTQSPQHRAAAVPVRLLPIGVSSYIDLAECLRQIQTPVPKPPARARAGQGKALYLSRLAASAICVGSAPLDGAAAGVGLRAERRRSARRPRGRWAAQTPRDLQPAAATTSVRGSGRRRGRRAPSKGKAEAGSADGRANHAPCPSLALASALDLSKAP